MDTKLAAIIVHDIKNAIAVLEGELRDMTTDPCRQRALQAHDTCLTLQEKLIGFLTLYKASSQGLTARIDAYCPEDFLNALLRQLPAVRPEVSVNVDTRDMPVVGFFDEILVGLALEAAMQNAMRFARSRIDVGCRPFDGGLVFTIHDDGAGVGAKEEAPSTGLGMDLCKAIAEAHGKLARKGSVLLSNHPEGGALFELRVP